MSSPSRAAAGPDRPATGAVLAIEGLTIDLAPASGVMPLPIVHGIDLAVRAGEVMALVGESGCGKSVTALAVMGLLPGHSRVGGAIRLAGTDLLGLAEPALERLRGDRMAMVFQEPMTALNPVMPVGRQVAEVLERHRGLDRATATAESVRLFDRVRLPRPATRRHAFPFELSGGQRQRVMIAMALACGPALLIADEPTTALDVTVQAGILALLLDLVGESGMAVLLISHDLGVVAETADRVAVMYAGRIVETAPVADLFARPAHPYTVGLLASLPGAVPPDRPLSAIPGIVPMPGALPPGCAFAPRCPTAAAACSALPPLRPIGSAHRTACHVPVRHDGQAAGAGSGIPAPAGHETGMEPQGDRAFPQARDRGDRCGGPDRAGAPPLLVVEGLTRCYGDRSLPGRAVAARTPREPALDAVSFAVTAGESLGIVGESGSGKSTLARLVMALDRPTAGSVRLAGIDLFSAGPRRLRRLRRTLQMVFQDPNGSLNPRHRVSRILEEPLIGLGIDPGRAGRRDRIAATLDAVGLRPADGARYPHEFSGGQRQRLAIARALIVEPALIVADEPVSALDMSIQAQMLTLMAALQRDRGVTYLFISHDLAVVRRVASRVLVLHRGRVVEQGPTEAVFARPAHPYTRALVAAVPDIAAAGHRRRTRRRDHPGANPWSGLPAVARTGPDFAAPLSGCLYVDHCRQGDRRCRDDRPILAPARAGAGTAADRQTAATARQVACHHPMVDDG